MPVKTIGQLDLYGKIQDLTKRLKQTINMEEIDSPDIYQKLYHIEPPGVTLQIQYLPTGSYISLYGSDNKISEVEKIVNEALKELQK